MAGVESILINKENKTDNTVKAIESWIGKLEEIERKLKLLAAGS